MDDYKYPISKWRVKGNAYRPSCHDQSGAGWAETMGFKRSRKSKEGAYTLGESTVSSAIDSTALGHELRVE